MPDGRVPDRPPARPPRHAPPTRTGPTARHDPMSTATAHAPAPALEGVAVAQEFTFGAADFQRVRA